MLMYVFANQENNIHLVLEMFIKDSLEPCNQSNNTCISSSLFFFVHFINLLRSYVYNSVISKPYRFTRKHTMEGK